MIHSIYIFCIQIDTVVSRFSKRKFSKLSRFSKLFQGDRFFME